MKNNKYKIVIITFVFVFFISLPFIQSYIFSSHSNGSIAVDKKIKADFIKSDKKYVLLFFGYVGCVEVCTPLLQDLNNLYESKEFQILMADVDIIFINLTPEVETFQPGLFANFFNEKFKGVYLSKKETLNIDRRFGVYFSRSLDDSSELDHTDYLYLVQNDKNEKILKKMFSVHPLNKEKVIKDILELKVSQ